LKQGKENRLAKEKNTNDYWYFSIPFYIFIVLKEIAREIFKWISQIMTKEKKKRENHLNGLIMALLNHRLWFKVVLDRKLTIIVTYTYFISEKIF